MFRVTVDLGDFHTEKRRTRHELLKACDDGVRDAAMAGRDEGRRGSYKDRTGELRRKTDARPGGFGVAGSVWEIVAAKRYAIFVDAGTRPHPILPKNGVFLRFKVGDRVVFARKVNHPGTRGTAFMGKAYLKAESVLNARLDAAIARIASRWR